MGRFVLLVLLIVVAYSGWHVWAQAEAVKGNAEEEFKVCVQDAPNPKVIEKCKAEWKKAQDAYNIP